MVTNVAPDSIFFKSNFKFCYYSNTATWKTSICTFDCIWLLFLTQILGLYSKKVCFLGHLWKPGNQCRQLIINVKLFLNKDYYLLFTIKKYQTIYSHTTHNLVEIKAGCFLDLGSFIFKYLTVFCKLAASYRTIL